MKKTTSLFVVLLIMGTVLLTGCSGGPSEIALWFVSLYPELGPSYADIVLKGRLLDTDLERLARGNQPTKVLEEQILEHSLQDSWDEFRQVGFLDHPNRSQGYSERDVSGIRFYPYIGYDKDSYWAFVKAMSHSQFSGHHYVYVA